MQGGDDGVDHQEGVVTVTADANDDCLVGMFPWKSSVRFRICYAYMLFVVGGIVGVLGTVITAMGI